MNSRQSVLIVVFFIVFGLAACSSGANEEVSAQLPVSTNSMTLTPEPTQALVLTVTPTFTSTPTEIPLPTQTPFYTPELVGEVLIGNGPDCDLYRLGYMNFEGDWRTYEVFFTDPVQCRPLALGDIQWVNYTYINHELVRYTKQFAHDIDRGALIDELRRRLDIEINEMSLYAVYPQNAGVANNHGFACVNDNSKEGEFVACFAELGDYSNRLIVHLTKTLE